MAQKENALLSLQVQTDQAALSQGGASGSNTRFFCQGFGFAVMTMMGVSASVLLPNSHAAAEPSSLAPESATRVMDVLNFNPPMPVAGSGPERATAFRQQRPVVAQPVQRASQRQSITVPNMAGACLRIEGGFEGEVPKGELLRDMILESKTQLYAGFDRGLNCGGNGQCLTCRVEVLQGMQNLSPVTDPEKKMLAKRPPNYRLACQCLINGDVTIKTLPK